MGSAGLYLVTKPEAKMLMRHQPAHLTGQVLQRREPGPHHVTGRSTLKSSEKQAAGAANNMDNATRLDEVMLYALRTVCFR